MNARKKPLDVFRAKEQVSPVDERRSCLYDPESCRWQLGRRVWCRRGPCRARAY